jgi:hypothetical protein
MQIPDCHDYSSNGLPVEACVAAATALLSTAKCNA